MSNSKEYQVKRTECERLYLDGKTNAGELATIFGVRPATVENWIRKYNWKNKETRLRDLDAEIMQMADEALLTALEEYKKDPANKDLQSLRGMLKEYIDRKKPSRQFLDYVIKFQEQFKEFCLDGGYGDLWEEYRKIGSEFSEYLRVRNG